MSYDIKVWHVIKKGNLPIPPKKDANGQVITSTDPLIWTTTLMSKLLLSLSMQKQKIYCTMLSVEKNMKRYPVVRLQKMWDKLEVTYEGINNVIETRINLLVREYELFQMKDDLLKKCFPGSAKFLETSNHLEDLLKVANRGDLVEFEKTHLDRHIQEKKKIVAFKATMAEPENEDEEEGGEQDENIAMLSQVVTNMMRRNRNYRRGKSNLRKGRVSNETDQNNGRCYECGKFGHVQADCPELKKKLSRNMQKKKAFGAWSDEEESDHEKIANIFFMALSDDEESEELGLMADNNDEEDDSREPRSPSDEGTSEVCTPLCPNCYELQIFVDISLADIERVVNELKKVKREKEREKKDWALKLEVCKIEHDMLQDEVNKLKLQLNGLKRTSSSSPVKSDQNVPVRKKIACSFCGKNGHSTNNCRNRIRAENSSGNSNNSSCTYCGKRGHTSNHCRFKNDRRWIWRPKSSIQTNSQIPNHSGPKQAWVPKNK
ncbi:PREDICTED: uncharacterized protein LOC109227743 [Nicotiana attenuata]|uniref:uncharacterized protein LOC109227743 n=1 Tax=Nicotiana attenuata TaxID=49451 RepID=UPI0009053FC9|nr:PREDICTED: uncharacterized protein LOC109227743 [Nicotiana attenuata]